MFSSCLKWSKIVVNERLTYVTIVKSVIYVMSVMYVTSLMSVTYVASVTYVTYVISD